MTFAIGVEQSQSHLAAPRTRLLHGTTWTTQDYTGQTEARPWLLLEQVDRLQHNQSCGDQLRHPLQPPLQLAFPFIFFLKMEEAEVACRSSLQK
jgi:hypothetical protein